MKKGGSLAFGARRKNCAGTMPAGGRVAGLRGRVPHGSPLAGPSVTVMLTVRRGSPWYGWGTEGEPAVDPPEGGAGYKRGGPRLARTARLRPTRCARTAPGMRGPAGSHRGEVVPPVVFLFYGGPGYPASEPIPKFLIPGGHVCVEPRVSFGFPGLPAGVRQASLAGSGGSANCSFASLATAAHEQSCSCAPRGKSSGALLIESTAPLGKPLAFRKEVERRRCVETVDERSSAKYFLC